MSPMDNPYQPPLAHVAEVEPASDDPNDPRRVRRAHIQHEASIRSFGLLYLLGGGFGLLAGALGVVAAVGGGLGVGAMELGILALLSAFGAAQAAVGVGLRRLDPRARIPGSVLAALSMVSVPLGTLLGAYALWLFNSRKGRTILSPAYAAVAGPDPRDPSDHLVGGVAAAGADGAGGARGVRGGGGGRRARRIACGP